MDNVSLHLIHQNLIRSNPTPIDLIKLYTKMMYKRGMTYKAIQYNV